MRLLYGIIFFTLFGGVQLNAQEDYNNCVDALEICPNETYSVNNLGANITFCPGCEDDFAFCFTPQNSIWLSFTTNAAGGDVQVDFSNLVFEMSAGQDNELQATIIEAIAPCDATTYTQLGNCVSNASVNFSLNAVGLNPTTTYYIVIDGDNNGVGITEPAECTFDIAISGAGVDRPVSSISIDPIAGPFCLQETVTFTASVTDCPDTGNYQWFINGVLAATTTIPNFQTSDLVQGDVVSVQTACYLICPATPTDATNALNITSFPIDAGPDQTIQLGESAILGGVTTAPTFQWTPTFNVSNPLNLNPVVTPTETVTYTLTATQGACTLTDQATIIVASLIEIPNSFSPNNDGANDTWIIQGTELYPDASLKVYTRWGQPIYETIGYSELKAWDGTDQRGKPAATGVYFYVLELRDTQEQEFKGSLTIMR
ncbi:MAG: gliding motility-associated C-terminal domain-containing protein [Crocinitomicaceae bacterium]|nr:gliding motility-associated C-terminal domain-containing protein [Crocinitomicaceae bacterium]